ncbi:unnamed protein product [Ilex paraguariensis]|uniref:Uncharacterized protein n=1 Tax=Ilex paraguariensis TaxID=185542 RepID=A0ABC8QYE2_9AQUA
MRFKTDILEVVAHVTVAIIKVLALDKIGRDSVLKSSPRRSPRREARRGELISPGGPQAKRT